MNQFQVPVTGVSAVNARGELMLIIEPVAANMAPTAVRQLGNRLAVLSGHTPVSVRGYAERASDAARRKGMALILEVDAATSTHVRETMVPVESE